MNKGVFWQEFALALLGDSATLGFGNNLVYFRAKVGI